MDYSNLTRSEKSKVDLSNQVFGLWTVLKQAASGGSSRKWECRCKCGTTKSVYTSHLVSGASSNCGCARTQKTSDRNFRHGKAKTTEYKAWKNMRTRCKHHQAYIAQNIDVCDKWQNSFDAFLADMGPAPTAQHTVERIENSKNYQPGNCRWATWAEQSRNKRTNNWITHDGLTLCITDWSTRTGLSVHVIYDRIFHLGWDVADALTMPVKRGGTYKRRKQLAS